MNVLAMKLESRQQLTEGKLKDGAGQKKLKGSKKKNLSIGSDKDAVLDSYGLGRKFCVDYDLNTKKYDSYSSKKNRSKKSGLKVDKMLTESDKIQERLQRSLSDEDKEKIMSILNQIRALSDVEKLYLYLQLPTGSPFEVDPFKQKNPNPLGKKADEEGMFAVTWIQSHLEEDPDISLPKQEVYDEYQAYCNLTGTDPLCAADFGKVMKQIFPSVKPRRLGTRGNSRYCYSGLRKKSKLLPPSVPDIQKEKENCASEDNFSNEVTAASCHLLFEWVEKLFGIQFRSLKALAAHLLENMYVDNRSVAAFTVLLDASPQLLSKGFSASDGGIKKTEAQFHLQRKIQEKELIKEQKRKLQEQRTCIRGSKGTGAKKKSFKARKVRSPPEDTLGCDEDKPVTMFEQNINEDKMQEEDTMKKCEEIHLTANKSETSTSSSDLSVDVMMPKHTIKKEDCLPKSCPSESNSAGQKMGDQAFSSVLISPLSSPCNGLDSEESLKRKSRNAILQNKPAACIAQSIPSIIIVPSLPHISADIGKQNTSTPKYKRIQPKPLQGELFNTIVRSRAGSVGSSFSTKPKTSRNDGRRSSHAWLQSDCFVENGEEKSLKNISLKPVPEKHKDSLGMKDGMYFEVQHESKLTLDAISKDTDVCSEKQKGDSELHGKPRSIIQSNLQIMNSSVKDISSVKRHLDDTEEHTVNKRVHLELSSDSVWIQKSANSNNLPSSQDLLSKQNEEVNVLEIEGDALNDYLRGVNNNSCSSTYSLQQSELEQQLSSNNKVKQLSQLRMLLEMNLPGAVSKTSFIPGRTQKVSKSVDTNENSLPSIPNQDNKKSYSLLAHDPGKILMTQSAFQNVVVDSSLKNDPQMDSLEKLLSSSYLTPSAAAMDSQALSDPNLFLNCTQSNVQDVGMGDILLSSTLLPNANDPIDSASMSYERVSTCTQVPSVPQSPNTRRRAFNFMPISPRHTPVPESITMSGGAPRTMMSTGVGTSQPPSNSGSPFVSPRSTPVPLCRSRHSSGQSTYSTSRHTPFQNFDSGVSSVSSSPFISPQPTPVPVSRLRHNSSHGTKTVTFCSISSPQMIHGTNSVRSRHSSGPGAANFMTSPCTSLSPLVAEQGSAQSFVFPSISNEARSRHNSGSNVTTPLSPVSEQASSSSSCASNMPDITGIHDLTTLSTSQSFLNDGAGDLLISANPSGFRQVRQRHASSSVLYGKPSYSQRDIFSQEIQKLLKNNITSDVLLNSNRSQSVPLHQMLQTADGLCFLTQAVEDPNSKSHPSTPIMNQVFSFSAEGQDTVLLSNQEVSLPVNHLEKSIGHGSQMEWSAFDGSAVGETSSARRNLAALYDSTPLSDDLQTTLEDLRDCDTDFSKLELELRQNEESGL